MRDFLKTLVWGVLALLLGALVYAVFALVSIATEVNRTLQEFQLTAIEARSAITAVAIQANWTQQDALKIVDATAKDIRYQTKVALDRADKRIGEALEKSDARIAQAIGTLDEAVAVSERELGRMNDTVASVAEPIRHSAVQVDETLPLFLDCEMNANCIFNRYAGMAKGVEQASIAIGKATPETAEAIKGITQSVDTLAARFAKEKPWYRKLLDAIPLAGGLASMF